MAARNGFHLEPRCRICRNDLVRKKVNDLLASGTSYAMVLRALGEHNTKLANCDRVTIDSIRNHTARHFPVQNVAKATYERSSNAGQRRTASTSSRAWPPRSRPLRSSRPSWSRVTRPLSTRTPRSMCDTGIVAAGRLQSLIDSRDYEPRIVGDEGPDGPDLRRGQVHGPAGDVGGDHREAGSWSSIRRRSTSTRTPSMTTTIPSIRPSSSTRTTSFDLRSARRHRGDGDR